MLNRPSPIIVAMHTSNPRENLVGHAHLPKVLNEVKEGVTPLVNQRALRKIKNLGIQTHFAVTEKDIIT